MAWFAYTTDCLILGSLLLVGSGVVLVADSWFPRNGR